MSSKNAILLGLDGDGNKLYSNAHQNILLIAPHGAGKKVWEYILLFQAY
ncbi:Putative VirD4 domain-containing protein [Candidatus Trichorickettsia mobilis]|uniref:VirD4 domain-containing protein n=1 Tax=Candidatus Trichorickettsia mobilis TaxID=1346319 RepID=A0ABZ0UTT8_9RICK|nr:hypothetical protein [Candidatus Trichorickettsia mobilis]WPY01458.1 Putative VirD4 domain-containing protein [Candidatus Trichorickettsia mobilis]